MKLDIIEYILFGFMHIKRFYILGRLFHTINNKNLSTRSHWNRVQLAQCGFAIMYEEAIWMPAYGNGCIRLVDVKCAERMVS